MGNRKNEDFAKLQSEWYGKLAQEGFDDLENPNDQDAPIEREKIQDTRGDGYYEFCQAILRDFKFKRDLDRLIFELHTEGRSEREIAAYLKEKSYKIITHIRVHQIIKATKEKFLVGPR